MPRAWWCRDEIYEFFDRWRRECLIGDGALFSVGAVWTDANLTQLQTTLGSELLGAGTFFGKLRTQLAEHSPVVRQLGVEIVYVEYLGERDTGADKKRENLETVLDLVPDGVSLPDDLNEILDGGIASYGPGKQYRDAYVRFLLKLARRAKEAGPDALEDPWRFRDVVSSVRTSTDAMEANAVLHACFPDHFDVMISSRHREKLLGVFGGVDVVAAAEDEDHKLLAVREVLLTRLPEPIDDPYSDAVRAIWDAKSSPEWDELVARTLATLPVHVEDVPGPPPSPDPDLLERLQKLLGETAGWEFLLSQAASRVAAQGGAVRSWDALVAGLRVAVDEADVEPEPEPAAPVPAELPQITAELAHELLMTQSWLQGVLDILGRRRQLILYGPPGTGKTFLARRIAQHAFDSAAVRLVQFHPSYTYEDFVEGYRPRTGDDGTLSYELVWGPLRELSDRAAENPGQPHLLIIDEINRGNLPKIFGELYFLLEYRDEPMRLQYSSDTEFSLSANLYIVGTMNTADRSIALLDAALRRRFAFVELSPRDEPVRDLLESWLKRHDLDPEPATLLETLNSMLEAAGIDADLAIGPSYFMDRAGTDPDLETIWRYDILPLLVERFYGTGTNPRDDFSLDAVKAEATRRADDAES